MRRWLPVFAVVIGMTIVPGVKAESRDTTPKIAVLPMVFVEDHNYDTKSGAIKVAKDALSDLLHKSGYELIDEGRIIGAWDAQASAADKRPEYKEIPTDKDLLTLGKTLGVNYVIAGTCSWHVKSIWVGFGPKTKALCHMEMRVIDVNKSEVDYTSEVDTDSTRKESALGAAGTILLSPLCTVCSGGPKTPHMEASAKMAIAKSFGPWLKKHKPADVYKIK